MIAGEIQSFCENFEETLVWNFQISVEIPHPRGAMNLCSLLHHLILLPHP